MIQATIMPAHDASLALWEDARRRMIGRLRQTIATPLDGFPDHADVATGRWITKADGDCTGGFFAGWLWLAAKEHPEFKAAAQQWAYALRPRVRSKTHYRGMLFYQGTVLGALLFDDQPSRALAIEAAHALAEDFNEAAGVIGLGEEGEKPAISVPVKRRSMPSA